MLSVLSTGRITKLKKKWLEGFLLFFFFLPQKMLPAFYPSGGLSQGENRGCLFGNPVTGQRAGGRTAGRRSTGWGEVKAHAQHWPTLTLRSWTKFTGRILATTSSRRPGRGVTQGEHPTYSETAERGLGLSERGRYCEFDLHTVYHPSMRSALLHGAPPVGRGC